MSNLENEKTYGLFANPQNIKLISELKQKGANLLILPPIRTEVVELTEKSKELMHNLREFDWLILTDIFAAEYFIESLREIGVDFFELDDLTVCAFGEAVADRLRFVQVHADIIPSKTDDETIFSTISQYVGGDFTKLRFLVVKENSAAIILSEKLNAANASIDEIAVYRTASVQNSEKIRLQTLIKNGAVDEFVFSAAEDLLSFKSLFPENDLAEISAETKFVATSEIVYQSLQEQNLRPAYFQNK